MLKAKEGDSVKVHYTGTFQDGNVFDSSLGGEPLEFALGKGQMIPGFEKAILGMQIGEDKKVTIPSNEAYGEVNEEMFFTINRTEIPDEVKPEVGMRLNAQTGQGQSIQVFIKDFDNQTVTLDANHPLAGKDLNFEIKLVEITPSEENGKKPLLFD